MDYSKQSRDQLIALCKEKGVKGYSGKKKDDLIKLLSPEPVVAEPSTAASASASNQKLKMIDLFAGTGAFTHAFEQTGNVECVFANDMVEWSKRIYDENHDHKLTLQDLNTIPVEEIPEHDILTGGFPCFVAGTRVLTHQGYKKIEEVTLEDALFTHTGTFQPIRNLQRKHGVEEIYAIDIMYHPHLIQTTAEHPFYVKERIKTWNNDVRTYRYHFSEPKWVLAKDMTTNHYAGMAIDTQSIIPSFDVSISRNQYKDEVSSITLDNEDHWFLMGYFLGDGWVQDSRRQDGRHSQKIYFSIADKDVSTIVPRLHRVLPIVDHQKRSGASSVYGCGHALWWSILTRFERYSAGKFIPDWVQSAPKNLIEAFLEGYRSADGCIQPSSKGIEQHHISYTTISHDIAFSIQRLYLKLGMFCSIDYTLRPSTTVIQGRAVTQQPTYRMRVLLHQQRESSCLMEENYAWMKVKTSIIKHDEPQTVYNFEVEQDNSYCIENTIVHNCQPFSIAGKQEGFEDVRSNVFWKILEIIDHRQPRAVVLENVKNLVSHDEGKTFKTIKDNLTQRGYHVQTKVLNTSSITGIPQHRERIYIVCLKNEETAKAFNLTFPDIEKRPISDMLTEEKVPSKYYYTDASTTWPLVSAQVTKPNTIYQYRRVYVRENKSNECPTLTANMGGGGHNVPLVCDDVGIRKLTPRECFNFQGFPASYRLPQISDTHLYKLAGNAVSVPVVKLIADRLVPLL